MFFFTLTDGDKRRKEFRAWWMVARDIIAFIAGLGILFFETGFEDADRPWILAAALALMGFPFAAAADRWLRQEPPKLNGSDKDE